VPCRARLPIHTDEPRFKFVFDPADRSTGALAAVGRNDYGPGAPFIDACSPLQGILHAMASQPPPVAVSDGSAAANPGYDKVRLRFRKSNDLRFLSHHDLMRAFERMLRRATLPVRQSQGFNPHPRLVFALSLPLGVVGCEEVLELELDEILPLDEIRERLVHQAPPGLDILSIKRIAPRAGAQVHRLTYRLVVPSDRVGGLAERIVAIFAEPKCWVERTRPPARRLDIRPFLADLRLCELPAQSSPLPPWGGVGLGVRGVEHPTHQPLTPHFSPLSTGATEVGSFAAPGESQSEETVHTVEMELYLTSQGTARPEEVLSLLGLNDLVDAGAVLERSRLDLVDESTPTNQSELLQAPLQESIGPNATEHSTAEGIA
jgi:radical SAM-linked protein